MNSLAERWLDPLQILIDAAHEHGMEFIASLRAPAYLGLDKSFIASEETKGVMAEEAVRDSQLAILTELARDYNTDGVEIDLSCAPRLSAEGVGLLARLLCEPPPLVDEASARKQTTAGRCGL